MTEKVLYYTLRKNLAPKGVELQRIETYVASGIPDLNFCYQGVEGWIELKKLPRRKQDKAAFNVPHLRSNQCAWIKRRCRNGGRVFLLVQAGHDIILIHGSRIYEVYTRRWTWGELDKFAINLPAPVDYDKLLAELIGPTHR